MKFDELKEIWNQDSEEDKLFKTTLSKKLNTHNPMDKVKNIMKWELLSTWVFILILIAIPIINPIRNKSIQLLVYMALNLTVLATLYYHILFYKFYKERIKPEMSSFMHLVEFIAEFRINLNLYRSYNYVLITFIMPAIFIYKGKNCFEYIDTISDTILWQIILFTSIAIILVIIFCELWIHFFYGKYLRELYEIKKLFVE